MYVANVAEDGFANNPYLDAVRERAATEGADVVPVCAAIEAEIAQLDEGDRAEFLEDLGLHEPGLDRVIRAAYHLLGLQTYFTAGAKEVRAWTVHAARTAPQAAGVIHTDFEHGFIRAEVIAYDDFIALQGRAGREGGRQAAARGQGIRRAATATSCTSASTSSRLARRGNQAFNPACPVALGKADTRAPGHTGSRAMAAARPGEASAARRP